MHITGIVAEYNPFHNGHLYQIERTKQELGCDFVIVAMSGHFSQRGVAAITDKFVRTKMALLSGVDMVLELPVPYATASAERFAQAAISLFNKTGIVNTVSFGSECGDITLLTYIAHLLESSPSGFDACIKDYLKQGMSFPSAREKAILDYLALKHLTPDMRESLSKTISSPNNILGIEYIKAIMHYHAPMEPFTLKRLKAGYHDTRIHASIASATAIRTNLSQNNTKILTNCMPSSAHHLLSSQLEKKPNMDLLVPFLQYKLMFTPKETLYSLWDIPKDLIHSFVNHYQDAITYEDFVKIGTSKTYTSATVSRALLRLLLGFENTTLQKLSAIEWIPYIRVLGCNKKSTILLKHLTQNAHIPVITNIKQAASSLDEVGKTLMTYELNATKLYHYLSHEPKLYQQDFTHPFILQ